MSEKIKAEFQGFRPKKDALKRIISQDPAAAAAMAEDTIKNDLGLGKKNPAARVKQIIDARQTIKDVKGDTHEPKK